MVAFGVDSSGGGSGTPVIPDDLTVPASPSDLTVLHEGNQMIQLGWSAPAAEPELESYQMDYKAAESATWNIACDTISAAATTYTQSGLTNGTTYQFRLKALVSGNWSEYSSLVSGTPQDSGGSIGVFDGASRFTSIAEIDKTSIAAYGLESATVTVHVYDAENDAAEAGESVYFTSNRAPVEQFMDAYGTELTPAAGNVYCLQTDAEGKVIFKVKSSMLGNALIGVGLLPGETGTTDLYAYLNEWAGATAETCGLINTHSITITEPQANSLVITTYPTKLTYRYGESLQVAGGVITITTSSPEISPDIPLSIDMVSGYDSRTLGEQTLTVTFGGKTTTYNVNVEDLERAQSITMFIGATGYVQDRVAKVADVAPFIQDGRAFGPVHHIAEGFGALVDWDEKKTLTLTRSDRTLTIVKGSNIITKVAGGVTTTHEAAEVAILKDGYIVLPVRAIADMFDAVLYYDAASQAVTFSNGIFDGADRFVSTTAIDKEIVVADAVDMATVTVYVRDSGCDDAGAGELVYFASKRGANDQFTDDTGTELTPVAGNVYMLQTDSKGKVIFKVKSADYGYADIGIGLLPGDTDTTDLYAYLNEIAGATAEACGYIDTHYFKFKSTVTTSIAIKTCPTKLTYQKDESLDVSGGVIAVIPGIPEASADIPLIAEMVSGFSSATLVEKTLTVTYDGKTTTYMITVAAASTPPNGGAAPTPVVTPPPVIKTYESPLSNPITPGDKELDKNLKETGKAIVDLSNYNNRLIDLSPTTLLDLTKDNKPLNVQGSGVKIEFSPAVNSTIAGSLQNNQTVQIGAQEISSAEKEKLLANAPIGESTGIFEIGGKVFDFTAQIVATGGGNDTPTKITGFSEPVPVTIDLSGLDLTPEEISNLCGVRLEKDDKGEIVPVLLGGTYDSESKTFTFYTERFSHYTVFKKRNLVKMNLTIGADILVLNGATKKMDVPPSIINNRTMVPLRFIGEAIGATFDWDEITRTVTFTSEGKEVKLEIDKPGPGLDTPATIVSGRTLVPLRYITEAFGAQVMWFPSTKTVSVVK